jgi:predicted nucleic acid-binding protein
VARLHEADEIDLGTGAAREGRKRDHYRRAVRTALIVYLDSSAIVKLYAPEAESTWVAEYVRGLRDPLPFSHLHEIEVKNALRLKVFREEVRSRPISKSIQTMDKDMSSQILKRPELNWIDVFRKAEELSKRFTPRAGSRSLDLLHVASSLLIPCREFLTFDARQASVAKKAGLRIVRLGRRAGS